MIYRNTVLQDRGSCLLLHLPVCLKCRYASLLGKDSTGAVASISQALIVVTEKTDGSTASLLCSASGYWTVLHLWQC